MTHANLEREPVSGLMGLTTRVKRVDFLKDRTRFQEGVNCPETASPKGTVGGGGSKMAPWTQ